MLVKVPINFTIFDNDEIINPKKTTKEDNNNSTEINRVRVRATCYIIIPHQNFTAGDPTTVGECGVFNVQSLDAFFCFCNHCTQFFINSLLPHLTKHTHTPHLN